MRADAEKAIMDLRHTAGPLTELRRSIEKRSRATGTVASRIGSKTIEDEQNIPSAHRTRAWWDR